MDCTAYCKFKQHGNYLTSACTVEPLEKLWELLLKRCANPLRNYDSSGRNILHMCASLGRRDLLNLLLNENQLQKKVLQLKDKESGWTPLHRAVYYGHIDCAVLLYKALDDWKPFDNEGNSPLDLLVLDSPRTNRRKGKKERLAITVLPFDSGHPGNLTLNTGDYLEILHTNNSGWAVGRLKSNGNKGLFPINFVNEIIENKEKDFSSQKGNLHSDVYSWGNNINFNLGFGDSTNRTVPELNETLWKLGLCIKDVCLTKFHSVYLTECGQVLSCGHGLGGRLGHDSEETFLYPKKIAALSCHHCTAISAANYHTLVLNEKGEVFSFGLNDYRQLGHTPPPTSCIIPTLIDHRTVKNKHITGIAAARFHSAIYTKTELFTFGLNAGQIGQPKDEEFQMVPKVVSHLYQNNDNSILKVDVSDGVTLCLLENGHLFILKDYICRKIATNMVNVIRLFATGGFLNIKGPYFKKIESLNVAVLLDNGVVKIWRQGYSKFKKCFWVGSKVNSERIIDIALGKHITLIMSDGQVYMGYFSKNKSKRSNIETKESQELYRRDKVEVISGNFSLDEVAERYKKERNECEEIQLEKIPRVHRSTRCFCDPKSRMFSVVQQDPRSGLKKYPSIATSTFSNDLKKLINKNSKEDVLSDCIIKTKTSTIHVHKFMLCCRFGSDLFCPQADCNSTYELSSTLDTDVVIEWLETLYMGVEGSVVQPLDVFLSIKSNQQNEFDVSNKIEGSCLRGQSAMVEKPVEVFVECEVDCFVKKEETEFSNQENFSDHQKGCKSDQSIPLNTLKDWKKWKYLSDVSLESSDGTIFNCHKCILSSRSVYFENMFRRGWLESDHENNTIKMPMPSNVLFLVLDFLYTDNEDIFQELEMNETTILGEVLVYSDQLLVTRLQDICENALAEKVNLKNAVDIFQFACAYNSQQLMNFTCEFIVLNLAYYLESRLLEDVPADNLRELSRIYRNMVINCGERLIQPSYEHLNIHNNAKQTTIDVEVHETQKPQQSRLDCVQDGANILTTFSNIEKTRNDISIDSESSDITISEETPLRLSSQSNTTNIDHHDAFSRKERKKVFPQFKKKSQKERRCKHSVIKDTQEKKENVCPWGKELPSAPLISFKDLLLEEDNPRKQQPCKDSQNGKIPVKNAPKSKDPSNQWQSDINLSIKRQTEQNLTIGECFTEILESTQEEKQEQIRESKKSLTAIQLEEKAIESLKELYEKNIMEDEFVTVERIRKTEERSPLWDRLVC